jgi:signal peptidase I
MKKSIGSIFLFFLIVLFALFLKLFVFDILCISGPSMRPTLTHGTIVIEYRLAWGIPIPFRNDYLVRWGIPKKGEIVIFPWDGRYVIKRCVAQPLTPLVFSSERGYSVLVSGQTIPLREDQYLKMKDAKYVPAGMIFALGDNMAESRDSRDYGFVSIDSIRGKALWK